MKVFNFKNKLELFFSTMTYKISFLIIVLTLISCTETRVNFEENKKKSTPSNEISTIQKDSHAEETSGNHELWKSLSKHCGHTYKGEITSKSPGADFEGKELIMHVLECSDNQILIPFNVGDNRSRTWIFSLKNDLITLKHDHRKENGKADTITMYGGTTPNKGLQNIALFPADQETQNLIKYASTNLWWITLNDNEFTYNLKRIGHQGTFTITFDLTQKIKKPEPSWGWEEY